MAVVPAGTVSRKENQRSRQSVCQWLSDMSRQLLLQWMNSTSFSSLKRQKNAGKIFLKRFVDVIDPPGTFRS
jgi:hypothetical protein